MQEIFTPQELFNYQSQIEKRLITQLEQQQSPKKQQYTRLMASTCQVAPVQLLEKKAPAPALGSPIKEKMVN